MENTAHERATAPHDDTPTAPDVPPPSDASDGASAHASDGASAPDSGPGAWNLATTVIRGAYHQCGSGRRVKLYELEGQAWVDRGTGYCAGVYDEAHDEALLVTRREEHCEALTEPAEHAAEATEPSTYMLVVSTQLDTDDYLLRSPVVKDDVYQRQQDTLVVWTEPDGTDLALSFQEPEGCNEVWDFLTEVQLHYLLSRDPACTPEDRARLRAAYAGAAEDAAASVEFRLPAPSDETLPEIEAALGAACAQGAARRERAVEWLLNEDYLRKLVPVFDAAESRAELATLHCLHGIMKAVLALNDNVVVEYLLEDDVFFPAIGMLEYSPEFPTLKASYRDYLQRHAHFRAVVEFDDPNVVTKITDTYRLVYLRDVILVRLLDDATLSLLSSLIFFYQSDIVNYCVGHERCLDQVRELVQAGEVPARKHDAVLFLHQLCTMAKQIQLPGRLGLFRALVERDLLVVAEYALEQRVPAVRNAGAEIVLATLEYDVHSVRAHVLAQAQRGERPLLRLLRDLLLGDAPAGVQSQVAEAVRALLDVAPDALGAPPARAGGDPERFLTWLYKGEVEALLAPLARLPALGAAPARLDRLAPAELARYTQLAGLLAHIIAQHSFRSQYYVLNSGIVAHVGALLHAREKPMRLAAVRVFRACLATGNHVLHRHLVATGAVGALLALLEREAPRDNLVSSACLGFLEQVRRERIEAVRAHLVEAHAAQLRRLEAHAALQPCVAGLLAAPAHEASPCADDEARVDDAADEERYFAEDDAPLVPYGDEDEDDAELSATVARVRRPRREAVDDDELLRHVAKRRMPARDDDARAPHAKRRASAGDEKKLALRLSDDARQRAGAETDVAT